VQEINKENDTVLAKIKQLEKKLAEIVKEKDVDLGKQRKILSELENAKVKDKDILETKVH